MCYKKMKHYRVPCIVMNTQGIRFILKTMILYNNNLYELAEDPTQQKN